MARPFSKAIPLGILALAVLGCAALIWYGYTDREIMDTIPASHATMPTPAPVISALGRVEPISEEVQVGSTLAGRITEIRVEEGDWVERGQVLAIVENDDLRARLALAKANVKAKQAALARLLNGARAEERQEASALMQEAEELLKLAQATRERRAALSRSMSISPEELDRAQHEHSAARARVKAANERLKLIEAPPRTEDVELAKADLDAAQASLEEAQAIYEKSFVRAPITGRVLRKHRKPGEIVRELSEMLIVSLGDTSVLRVRAEVDERDIGLLRIGLPASVTASAYPNRYPGRIVSIGQVIGRKNIVSDDPVERVDTKVLEALIELEPGSPLVSGMRVDVFIEQSKPEG